MSINGDNKRSLVKNFIDRKALDRVLVGGAIVAERYSSGRPVWAGRHDTWGAQEFAVATDRYLSLADRRSTVRDSRIKRPAAEFNALHVGYFAVPPCTTVKVHAGAHACACTHTRGRRSAGRPAGLLHSPHVPQRSSYSTRSYVCLHTRFALTSGRKILPLCGETGKIRRSDSRTWRRKFT